jgi:hypothetical protein
MIDDRLALGKTKRLLLDWVNLPSPITDNWLDAMLESHREVFGSFANNRSNLEDVIKGVRNYLVKAWKSPKMHERTWWLFVARQEYSCALLSSMPGSIRNYERFLAVGHDHLPRLSGLGTRLRNSMPPPTAFDRASEYAASMSCCEGPNCEEPYFLRGAKRERYCSECKRGARLRSKRKYWNKKGKYDRKADSSGRARGNWHKG